jgi:hypothetical protein
LPGPRGADGEEGAAGTARAYAYVNANGSLDSTRSKNFASARRTGDGNYCVVLDSDAGIDPDTTPWAVSIVSGTISGDEVLVAYSSPGTCSGALDVGVRTASAIAGEVTAKDSAFSVVMP